MEYILRWVDGSARDKWLALNESTSENKKLYESIKRKFGMLKYNPYRGDSIKKDRIPKSYTKNTTWIIY